MSINSSKQEETQMKDLIIYANTVEPVAVNQLYNLLAQPPFRDTKVRIMPDVHMGNGCVVGFTSTMQDMVIPNVIGVDIGCGMRTVCLGKTNFSFERLDEFIKEHIPSGSNLRDCYADMDFVQKLYCYPNLKNLDKIYCSLGTLGGGNHFIEVDREEKSGELYLVIHTGSRNLGLQVAKIYQKQAIEACKNAAIHDKQALHDRLVAEGRVSEIHDALQELIKRHAERTKTPAEYCYLQGDEMEAYMHDMRMCQDFAACNREKIAKDILRFLGIYQAKSFETVHNYIDREGIIRKGAIAAYAGQRVIIPMNMRDGCLLAVGKGNPQWNYSAPHGAGRLYSRGEAKQLFTEDEFKQAMEGIYTTTATLSTIDESPMAYKPMEEITALIGETVEIETVIKPMYNFKAGN